MIFQNAGFKRKETDLKTILAKVDEETSDDKDEDKSESSNKDADSKLAEKLQKCEKVFKIVVDTFFANLAHLTS